MLLLLLLLQGDLESALMFGWHKKERIIFRRMGDATSDAHVMYQTRGMIMTGRCCGKY